MAPGIIIDCLQGSPEWHQARLGKVTASRLNDVMATVRSGEAASRRNYRAQLVVERLTGQREECYTNAAMQWGIDHEAEARALYELMTDYTVEEVGLVVHPHISTAASPDGLIGESGLVEIKCPNTATHIDYLLGGVAPAQYINQMQWQMECCNRQWCDFVSYDPRLPAELQLFMKRVARDEARLVVLRAEVSRFLVEIEETIKKLLETV